jgi:hypothetical protein
MDLWTILKIISMLATGGFAALALLTKYKDDNGKITKWGKIALGGIVLSFIFSLILFLVETSKAKEAAAKAKADADATTKSLEDIQHKAQTTVEQQRINLEETARLKSSSAENLKQQLLNLKRSDEIAKGMEKSLDAQVAVLSGNKVLQQEQGKAIEQIKRLSLDRNLSEVEISFKPSANQWSRIAKAYQQIKSPNPDMPYIDAPMIAEKDEDHWRIDFEPVKSRAGERQFGPVSTKQPEYKGFEDVIHEATIALLIKWSDVVETNIEPWRGDYPSGIRVERESIVLILRPPLLKLNLNYLYANPSISIRVREIPNNNPSISLRVKDIPSNLRFRSTDPGVMFDQTISSAWERSEGLTVKEKAKPYASGPHRLHITFKTISR